MQNIAQKSMTQEAAAVASEGIKSYVSDLKSIAKQESGKKVTSLDLEENIKELTGADKGDSFSKGILGALIKKAAGAGIDLDMSKAAVKNGPHTGADEVMSDDGPDSAQLMKDAVKISSLSAKKSAARNSVLGRAGAEVTKGLDPAKAAAVEKYASAYYSYLLEDEGGMSRSQRLKAKMEKLVNEMKSLGLSEEKIHSVQKQVRSAVRADIAAKIKDSLLMRDLSGSKLENIMHSEAAGAKVSQAFNNRKTGGWDFGNVNNSLQGTVNKANAENSLELREMIKQEFEDKLISKLVNGDKSVSDMKQLIELSAKSGLDITQWIQGVWEKEKDDLGLVDVDLPVLDTGRFVNTNSDNPKDQGRGGNGEYEPADEKELLVDSLRAVYMQRMVRSDFISNITTSFKIRKLKNGLCKLGIFTGELDEKVKFEAEVMARKKVADLLNETALERATIYDLKSSSSKLVDKKMEQLLKSAERLGMKLDQEEIDNLQARADLGMMEIVKAEMDAITSAMKRSKKPSVRAEKMLDKLKQLHDRLAAANEAPAAPENLLGEVA